MSDEKNETLGRRIARLRLGRAMTQERLANIAGVSPQAVSKWENDQSAPDISLLPLLAETFGVSIDELLVGARPATTAEPESEPGPVQISPVEETEPVGPVTGRKAHFLHIKVSKKDGEKTDVRVPLGVVSFALRAGSKIPGLSASGVVGDMPVNMGLLAEMIRHGECGTLIEVDEEHGDHVVITLE